MDKETFNILIVDDDPTVIRILRSILADFSPLRFATSGKMALELAQKSAPDLVLLDVEMPGLNGFEVCARFKADRSLSNVPIVFLTSHENAELQTAGLKLGAADFIVKPPHAALVVARVRAHMATKRLSDTLRSAASMDFLTGTASRIHFEKALDQELARARRTESSLCLLFLQIDDFNGFESTHGEDAADGMLRAVADVLRSVVQRPADLLARYAAGTFAALLPETDLDGANTLARRTRREIDRLNASIAMMSDANQRFEVVLACACNAQVRGVASANARAALIAAVEQSIAQALARDSAERLPERFERG